MNRFLNGLLRYVFYLAIFCTVTWNLANTKQRYELKSKFDTLLKYAHHVSSIAAIKEPNPIIAIKPSFSLLENTETQKGLDKVVERVQINSCAKVESTKPDHKRVIYQWIDKKGNQQLSDIAPQQDYTNLKVKNLHIESYFNLKLDSRYADLPAFTQSHIQSGVTKIYKTLIYVVKVSELRAINLNLKFFGEQEMFHSYRQKVAPDTGFKTTGFYTSRLNEASILAVGSKKYMTSITLHESTHAIVAAMFGGAPVWLNEGLASFFDQMIITGEQTYKFTTDDRKFSLLRNSNIPSLNSHFSQSPKEWYAYTNDDLNYAVDWSLVFYMMINSNRREFLRGMLEHLAVNDCYRFATIPYINQYYPGGMIALESNWLNWLRSAPSGTITF